MSYKNIISKLRLLFVIVLCVGSVNAMDEGAAAGLTACDSNTAA